MPSPILIAAIALLTFGGPILVLPSLLPDAAQYGVATALTYSALAIGLLLIRRHHQVRLSLAVFVIAVVVSWMARPAANLPGYGHFAGIGLGVLTMAVIARLCVTSSRLIAVVMLVTLGSTALLTRGSLATTNTDPSRASSQLLTPGFRPMPLGLPGLEGNKGEGYVNPNALGGTALILLPIYGSLVAAAALNPRHRRIMRIVGLVATATALLAIVVTLSRNVFAALAIISTLLGVRWKRGRQWLLLAMLIAALGLSYGGYRWRTADPAEFDKRIQYSAGIRLAIWRDGLDALETSPLLGIGINQFHHGARASKEFGTHDLPHSHNVLLQVALDLGVFGLLGYTALFAVPIHLAGRCSRHRSVAGRIAAGAGLSLVAVHLFGLTDTIALGAKVGIVQWVSVGLILAGTRLIEADHKAEGTPALNHSASATSGT